MDRGGCDTRQVDPHPALRDIECFTLVAHRLTFSRAPTRFGPRPAAAAGGAGRGVGAPPPPARTWRWAPRSARPRPPGAGPAGGPRASAPRLHPGQFARQLLLPRTPPRGSVWAQLAADRPDR